MHTLEMFILLKILLLILTLNLCCNALIIDPGSRLNSDFYINKCCPEGAYVGRKKTCVKSNKTLSFSTIKVYNEKLKETGKLFEDEFSLNANANKFNDTDFKENALDFSLLGFNTRLIMSGAIQLVYPNAVTHLNRIAPANYCVDYYIKPRLNMTKPHFWVVVDDEYPEYDIIMSWISITIPSLFLLLVLVVYSLLPELRNLAGLILMAHIFSMFMNYLLLGYIQAQIHTDQMCITLSMLIYFFALASFCWLSVLSFDIWWTFRNYAKASPINRRQKYFKFLMYSLFAFGVPLLMTVGVYTLNEMSHSLTHLPWFITPHVPDFGCFFDVDTEKLYLHIPMLILLICNSVLYSMTAPNIWRLSRGTTVLNADAAGNPQAHRAQKQRLQVYLKLSVVMGLSWLLELVISLFFSHKIWWLSDMNNILVSLAIFFIFVCKKEILKKLCKRWMAMRGCEAAKVNSSNPNSNQESTTNQLTVSSQSHGRNTHSGVSTNVIMDSTLPGSRG